MSANMTQFLVYFIFTLWAIPNHRPRWMKCWESLVTITLVSCSNSSFLSRPRRISASSWWTSSSMIAVSYVARRADTLCSSRGMEANTNAVQRRPVAGQKTKTKTHAFSLDELYFYQCKFGEVARQYRQPCTWSGNKQASH